MEQQALETNVVKPSLTHFEKEQEWRLISIVDEIQMDSKIKEIEDFMNNNHGRGKTELEKDKLYADAKNLWEEYATILRDVKFTFYLNKKQYQFLTDLLLERMEYDVNTVFLAIELTNMLGNWRSTGTSKDEEAIRGYTTDATEITYIYHLISKHKVKGLSNSAYRFAEVLRKIGSISKIIAYYDTSAKNMSKDIQNWVASFEENTIIEGKDWGKDKEPKSKKGKTKETETQD